MITQKDSVLMDYLIEGTEAQRIRWQPTAADNQFTSSLKGKYNVVMGTGRNGPWLRMSNEQDQIMLFIPSDDDPTGRIERLFEDARRAALDVDNAIDEIIQEG